MTAHMQTYAYNTIYTLHLEQAQKQTERGHLVPFKLTGLEMYPILLQKYSHR